MVSGSNDLADPSECDLFFAHMSQSALTASALTVVRWVQSAFYRVSAVSFPSPKVEGEFEAGARLQEPQASLRAELLDLRKLAGLTWDQTAALLGVTRRSVMFWASGGSMNRKNEEKLARLLSIVRDVDSGSAQSNRALLFRPIDSGKVVFDLLCEGDWSTARLALSTGQGNRRILSPKPLSDAARAERRPPSPIELVESAHD